MPVLYALQVLLLLLGSAALLLIALENRGVVTVPLPLSPEVWLLGQGTALLGAAALGAVWTALVLGPLLLRQRRARRAAEAALAERERQLVTVMGEARALMPLLPRPGPPQDNSPGPQAPADT